MRRHDHAKIHKCVCPHCQQHPYSALSRQHKAINRVLADLDEKNRRHFVGLLALQWGRGSVQQLRRITGLSRTTIQRGRQEVQRANLDTADRVRRSGAGRLAVEKNGPRY